MNYHLTPDVFQLIDIIASSIFYLLVYPSIKKIQILEKRLEKLEENSQLKISL